MTRATFGVIAIALLIGSFVEESGAAISINWEIGNRFRAFDYKNGGIAQDPEEAAKRFYEIAPKELETGALPRLTDWMEQFKTRPSPYANDPGPWIETPKNDQPPYPHDFVDLPNTIVLRASLAGEKSELQALEGKICSWELDGSAFAQETCLQDGEPRTIQHTHFPSSGGLVQVRVEETRLLPESGQELKPWIRIILGLGDSYASGEGNPDAPTQWHSSFKPDAWKKLRNRGDVDRFVAKPAQWQSNRCDRSYYSYQNLVALYEAVREKHAIVSFVHLACSGAEIVDGLLSPQRRPPGINTVVCNPPGPNFYPSSCDLPYSQLEATVKILCAREGEIKPLSPSAINQITAHLKDISYSRNQIQEINSKHLLTCDSMRPIESILLSIGGNDIGFSGIISYYLLPPKGRYLVGDFIVGLVRKEARVVCSYQRADQDCPRAFSADIRIKELSKRYKSLSTAFSLIFGANQPRIYLSHYPNPLHRGDSSSESSFCYNSRGAYLNRWSSSRNILLPYPEKWGVNMLIDEAKEAQTRVIEKLNLTISNSAQEKEWKLVPVPVDDVMLHHGWCVGIDPMVDALRKAVPSLKDNWNAYASSQSGEPDRYIRTANDSLLSQWPKTTAADKRDNGFNGTFHPNAYGAAAIAERVLNAIHPGMYYLAP